MKRKKLLKDLYGADIVFLFGTAKEVEAFVCRRHGDGFTIRPGVRANFCTFTPNDPKLYPIHYITLIKGRGRGDRFDHAGCLAHECSHAVFEIFQMRGIPCDKEHDEQFAYYHEWLFRQCLKEVW